jgi:hypothetical protein
MPADDEQTARLRELHDAYVWAVNAAVAEGRDDLVAELADGYEVEALRIMTEGFTSACDRPGCVHAPRPPIAARHHRGWLRLLGIRRARG